MFNKLRGNERGNTAMIYALVLLPLLVMTGGAIDFTRQQTAERHLLAATDAAAIAGVRYALAISEDEGEVIAEARRFFFENLDKNWLDLGIEPIIAFEPGEFVEVTASFPLSSTMLGLAGIQTLPVKAQSQAVYAAGGPLEIALVLDNSYSMVGQPMDDLKHAAEEFVDSLIEPGKDTVKIAIVPFGDHVNVGLENRYEPWLYVPPDYQPPGVWCVIDHQAFIDAGCTWVSKTCYNDGKPVSCGEWVCPNGVQPGETCYPHSVQTWHGCVLARGAPLDVKDIDYGLNRIHGHIRWDAGNCPAPIMPLTNNRNKLRQHINDLVPKSETMVFEGLSWGYRVLSPGAPFTEGRPYADIAAANGKKVLVLMSDGANTRSPDPAVPNSNHSGTDAAYSDSRTRAACEEIADAGIEVHVIALGLTDAKTLSLLGDCAGSADRFHSIDNSGKLTEVFRAISGDIREIALSR